MVLTVIKEVLTEKDALITVQRRAENYSVRSEGKLYYPYFWFFFSCSVKTFFGSRNRKASCLIDLLRNQAATTDPFITSEVETDPSQFIQEKYTEQEAYCTASTYMVHASIHITRSLLLPQLEVLDKGKVYKAFWIIECTHLQKTSFKVMVDSITGKYEMIPL